MSSGQAKKNLNDMTSAWERLRMLVNTTMPGQAYVLNQYIHQVRTKRRYT